jgi:hypothetical protein
MRLVWWEHRANLRMLRETSCLEELVFGVEDLPLLVESIVIGKNGGSVTCQH